MGSSFGAYCPVLERAGARLQPSAYLTRDLYEVFSLRCDLSLLFLVCEIAHQVEIADGPSRLVGLEVKARYGATVVAPDLGDGKVGFTDTLVAERGGTDP